MERLRGISDPVSLLEGLFLHAPVGFQIYTADGHSLLTNQAFRELFGSEPPPEYNVLEDDIAREQGVLALIHRAFAGETVHVPAVWYDPRQLRQIKVDEGRRVAMESTFFPLFDRGGKVSHVAIVFKDVTAEHLAREKAEESERRARLLAEAGAILVGSLDHVAALKDVARLMVPALGHYCCIDVVDGSQLRRVAVVHVDPAKQPLLDELQQRFPPREGSPQPAARVVRSGEPELLNDVDDTILAAHTVDGEHLTLIRRLELKRHLAVPLQTRGQTMGALSLGRGVDAEAYSPIDVQLACELGRRMASAIEVARLYHEAQEAIRARDEFLSIASHELKTPLTPL